MKSNKSKLKAYALAEAVIQRQEAKAQAEIIKKAVVQTVKAVAPFLKGDKGDRGLDGKPGPQGEKGLMGAQGLNGRDGANGRDGSPDSPGQIRDKLESLKGAERLDAKAIKGFTQMISNFYVTAGTEAGGNGGGGGGSSSVSDGGIHSINGLSALSQTLVVGSGGNDFGISSVGSAHTFNLPTVGASVRGVLTPAQYSAFIGFSALIADVGASLDSYIPVGVGISSYGGSTQMPRVTLDAFGRVSGVSLVNIAYPSVAVADALMGLNGLTAPYQGFTTTSSGSDFSISSGGSLHSFNLPNAGISSRGALSIAQYNAFLGYSGLIAGLGSSFDAFGGSYADYQTQVGDSINSIGMSFDSFIAGYTEFASGVTESINALGVSFESYINNIGAGISEYGGPTQVAQFSVDSFGRIAGASIVDIAYPSIPNAISSINGLTPSSQHLAVGSIGNDFAISSIGNTHTFNIPNAGISSRGFITPTEFANLAGYSNAIVGLGNSHNTLDGQFDTFVVSSGNSNTAVGSSLTTFVTSAGNSVVAVGSSSSALSTAYSAFVTASGNSVVAVGNSRVALGASFDAFRTISGSSITAVGSSFNNYFPIGAGVSSYGGSTQVAQFTVDARGRIQGASVVNIAYPAGGGEANTGSNVGVSGVGVYDSKSGVDLRFRSIAVLSPFMSVALGSSGTVDLGFSAGAFALGSSFSAFSTSAGNSAGAVGATASAIGSTLNNYLAITPKTKTITLRNVSSVEDVFMGYMGTTVTIIGVRGVVGGLSSPAVLFDVVKGTDASAAGTNLFATSQTASNTTTGATFGVTIPVISPVELLRVKTLGYTGVVDNFSLTLFLQ